MVEGAMRPAFLALLASSATMLAGPATCPQSDDCKLDLWTGEGVAIANWLIPEVNFQATAGSSTTDPERLAVGHHDPDRHGITVQAIELALSAHLSKEAYVFANYSAKIDQDDHWADEFEEYYLSLGGLPGGSAIKAGRFYTQFGFQNRLHTHDFNFVDQYLASGRIVGEDSQAIFGAEISLPLWQKKDSRWSDRLTVSFGAIPDGEEEAEETNHEGRFEGEGGLFQDHVATVDYTMSFATTSNSQVKAGISGAWGKNNFERHSQRYGVHAEYLWHREAEAHCDSCATEHPGEFFRWRSEAFFRRSAAAARTDEGDTIEDTLNDAGFYTTFSYGFPKGRVIAHLRGEYVSGLPEAGLAERWRVSPAIAWFPIAKLPINFKLQYNYDHFPRFGDEHSVWAQFTFLWGDCCAEE
jgi:hypothetical protein